MDLVVFILGILYLCGVSVGKYLAWSAVVFGVAKIIFAIFDNK